MTKTRDMEWAEGKLGGPLEETLPPLYDRFKTTEAVARYIGINRVTLAGWLKDLQAEVETGRYTVVRFPNHPSAC